MKMGKEVKVGSLIYVATYTAEEKKQHLFGLKEEFRNLIDEYITEDCTLAIKTPYYWDAKITITARVLDREGKVITRSKFIIEEVYPEGTMPPDKTILDWETMIVENVITLIKDNNTNTKTISINKVNNLLKNINNKLDKKKIIDKENNTEPFKPNNNKPDNMKFSAPVVFEPMFVSFAGMNSSEAPTENKHEVYTFYKCINNDLCVVFVSNDGEKSSVTHDVLEVDCELCNSVRNRLVRWFHSFKNMFNK